MAAWPICSPRTAFFWSLNVSVAAVRAWTLRKSFKEQVAALTMRPSVWKVMSQRRKA